MEEFQLEPGESITRAVRKHWLVFVGELMPFFILALLPLIALPVVSYFAAAAPQFADTHTDLTLANGWVRFILGLWLLFAWMGGFNAFTRYYLDQWIITTTRIVNVHQFGFFRREVTSFLLNHVQDVTTDVDGVFPTIFGFGTLRVETAGDESRHFVMRGIRDPEGLRDLIMSEIASLHGSSHV
jgi:hypothetical protein